MCSKNYEIFFAYLDQPKYAHLEPYQPVSSAGWSVLRNFCRTSFFYFNYIKNVVFDGTPRTRIDIKATSGALDGEASAKGDP